MRKKSNILLLIIYIACCVFALYYGWERNFLMVGIFLLALIVLGFIRFAINAKAYKNDVASYIPMRSVKLENSVEVVNGENRNPSEKVALMHIDEVNEKKVIIKLFKDYVPTTDCSAAVNK